MAFVVIQHLSPDFKSLMDELLARHTDLPIHLVDDGMQVEADHIYLMPSKKEMIISDGRLLLSERGQKQELTLPIDVFFRSLAHDCGSRAIAIVLSGGGSDGSRGIRDVQEAGGLVIVQDTHTAQFDGMPRTARDAGVADWVLAPEDMPHVLTEHGSSYASRPVVTAGTGTIPPGGIEAVYQMLQDEYGIDFTHYKPSTVTRRIERRLALAHSANIDEYVRRLREDRDELDVLYRDLLIGVTKFFRDTEAFDVLEQRVLPELLQNTPKDAPLRIWVAGCATGEEAYSMAIAVQDLMQKLGERPVKIFATDVHRGSLETAGRAVYDAEALANVSKERLGRYFLRIGDAFQVVPDIRQMVVFAHHNVIKDAPFTRVDLVTCRNLLIYLQPAAQQKVLSLFHFALKRGGVLFLGHSESNGPIARDFDVIDKHWRIYRKHTDAKMMVDSRLQPLLQPQTRATLSQLAAPTARHSLTQLLGTYDALLEDVMPPSLLVSERGELIHAFGGASRFLRLRDGRQDLNVLDVVDQDLKLVLVGGLKRALNEASTVVFKGVAIADGEETRPHKVSIRRVRSRNGGAPHLLISFEPMEGAAAPAPRPAELEIDLDQISREQLRGLEAELSHTKENLQSAIEELETSNEELQASNEELQASNEELQSTNEELQSVNEELYTVNAEYQRKISELTELANDMDNLLSSTQVGTVFLDQDLKIRKFTPQIAETFSLVPHDLGRPIETFAHKIDHPELVEELRRVLASGEPVERELRGVHGKAVFLRIFPYRAKGTVAGVVLTLIDVTSLKAAEDALFHERYLLNSLLATVPDAIYFRDERGKFIRTNHAMARRLGLREPAQAEGKTAFQLLDQAAALALHSQDEAVLRTGEPQLYSLEKRVGEDGGEAWDVATRLPLRDRANQTVGIIGIFRDVSDQKRAELKIRDAVKRRDEFLAMLSHELRNPLGAMVTATAMLKVDSSAASRAEKCITILERQSKQMSHLLDDLLEASRVTQHKIDLKKTALDLNGVVSEAIEAVRGQLESRAVELQVEINPRPLMVEGDPARLQQIHVNLLNNAAKYTPRGGHVRLRTGVEDSMAVIRVSDDGAGIRADMLESIFELFVQSRRTLDRAAGGLGVGLTLVRSLVTMHGGTVSAHSRGEGQGSEFVVRLPLARDGVPVASESVAAPARTKEENSHPDDPSPARVRLPDEARVLLVEDNADSREMLSELLALSGFKCRTAENGPEALALMEEQAPDVAILDVGLPGMDGFQLARRIRTSPALKETFLIALTGYGQPSDRLSSKEAGFDAHLVKPVRVEVLLELLEKLRSDRPVRHRHPAGGHLTSVPPSDVVA